MSEQRQHAGTASGHGLMRQQARQARILPEWYKPNKPSLLRWWLILLPSAGLLVFAICVFTLKHEQWRPIRATMAPITSAEAVDAMPFHCGPPQAKDLSLHFLVDATEAAMEPELAVRMDRPDAAPPQPVVMACFLEGEERRGLWVRTSSPLDKKQRYVLLTKDRRSLAGWMLDKGSRGASH